MSQYKLISHQLSSFDYHEVKVRAVFAIFLALTVLSMITLSLQGNEAVPKMAATMNTKVDLQQGALQLKFSSKEEILELTFTFDSKKFTQEISSQNDLGVFVEVSGKKMDYTIEFLEDKDSWDPTSKLEINSYETRVSFQQDPGWKILVIEFSQQD